MADLPNQTVDQIKSLVKGAIAKVTMADGDRTAANDVYKAAQDDSNSARVNALIAVSEAATQAKWEGELIETAVEAVKAEHNTGEKKNTSVNTFASELRNAMRPGVRGKVREMFATAEAAWEADASDKTLRRAFVRKYHMVVGHMFKVAQTGETLDAQALNSAAAKILRDRELDYTKIAKRLTAIREELKKFHDDFAVEGIGFCVEYLAEVSEKDLKDARKRAEQDAPEQEAPEQTVEHEAAEQPRTREDLIHDALRDVTGAAA